MTTKEKLGQLQLLGDPVAAQAALANDQLGGVFSVVGAAKLNALQKTAVEQTRLGIPLIFGLDVIHGYTTNFPIPLGQAAAWDPGVAATDAKIAAGEARPSGIHWTYAPMMDVTHEPRWGRIAEGDGEDPYLASTYAAAKTVAFQGASLNAPTSLAACAKHFVAYGGAEGGRDYNTVDVSIQRLHNLYLPPFKAAVEAGVSTVMTSFNTISGVPAHGNRYVVHDVLKGRYGFDGFVVSDYTGIQELIPHGLAADGADAATHAMRAGVDMEMVSTNYVDSGLALLQAHKITMAQVDDAVRRILTVKIDLGLFEHPYVDESGETTAPSAEARTAERAVAAKTLVLLRNENGVLPLSASISKIAVIGPLAKADYDLNGTWSGLGTGAGTTPPMTIADAITAAAPNATVSYAAGCTVDGSDTSGIAAAAALAGGADVAILVVGETAAMSGEAAARSDIGLPGVQQQLVDAVGAAQAKSVAVLVNGRPLTLTGVAAAVPAILEAWAPGLEGAPAIADVLFGVVNPGGKLPVSFPRSVGQIPIYYNHENTGRPFDPNNKYTSKYLDLPDGPLYGFGFGLSYTTFAISDLRLSSHRLSRRGGQVKVSVKVQNTGSRDGDEVVQLYLHDPVASIVQPVRRLRGFRRVTLKAGAQRRVTFTIGPNDVGFYDNNAAFVIEVGEIQVFVGNSSAASDLTDTFQVH
ncbi:MAG: beta-glucosidase BglX [Actinomycetota bacterium]|nr:beta-glucosidase BglX [Actinomycetota bacterium]